MFGPVISAKQAPSRPSPAESRVVGTKVPGAIVAASTGWRPLLDLEPARRLDQRPPPAVLARRLRDPLQRVELGERGRELLQRARARGGARPHLLEELELEPDRALLRRQDARLELLELGRDVALGVLQRLLADVVGRAPLALRVGDLEVVPKTELKPTLSVGMPLRSTSRRCRSARIDCTSNRSLRSSSSSA
jgi:hypothetical protein